MKLDRVAYRGHLAREGLLDQDSEVIGAGRGVEREGDGETRGRKRFEAGGFQGQVGYRLPADDEITGAIEQRRDHGQLLGTAVFFSLEIQPADVDPGLGDDPGAGIGSAGLGGDAGGNGNRRLRDAGN